MNFFDISEPFLIIVGKLFFFCYFVTAALFIPFGIGIKLAEDYDSEWPIALAIVFDIFLACVIVALVAR